MSRVVSFVCSWPMAIKALLRTADSLDSYQGKASCFSCLSRQKKKILFPPKASLTQADTKYECELNGCLRTAESGFAASGK
jgi:hypothetical protein